MTTALTLSLTFAPPVELPAQDTWLINCIDQTVITYNGANISLWRDLCALNYDKYVIAWNEVGTIPDSQGTVFYVTNLGTRRGVFHLLSYPTGPIVVDTLQELYAVLFGILLKNPPRTKEQLIINITEMQDKFMRFSALNE